MLPHKIKVGPSISLSWGACGPLRELPSCYQVGLAVVDLFIRAAYTSRDVACGVEALPQAPA
jgi:hypothetical protein